MDSQNSEAAILKTIWGRQKDGNWGIHGIKSLTLRPRPNSEVDFFTYENEMELMTSKPFGNIQDMFTSFGSTEFIMQQSILPVVAWIDGENSMRCLGTAFVISCSGYVMTASHVLLDPHERGYAKFYKGENSTRVRDDLNIGVIIPYNPAYGKRGGRFFPFEKFQCWGEWQESPLLHEGERFNPLTDIAICKIADMPGGVAHQPLNLSLYPFKIEEKTYTYGYAEMKDIPFQTKSGQIIMDAFKPEMYVSIGKVKENFPENHIQKNVPTPGPCFHFSAKIPGKMSGAPIMGADGAVVRGIVSRSFSNERHAYGAMLAPAMYLSILPEGNTLKQMMENGEEGITQIQGPGL